GVETVSSISLCSSTCGTDAVTLPSRSTYRCSTLGVPIGTSQKAPGRHARCIPVPCWIPPKIPRKYATGRPALLDDDWLGGERLDGELVADARQALGGAADDARLVALVEV